MADTKVDVVVIGAGLSGLSAALRIKDEAPKLRYVVLESENRFGGRTLTRTYDRDFGGGYVGGSQNYIHYLLRRFQIPTTPEFLDPGRRWLYQARDGAIDEFPGDNPLLLPGGTNALFRLNDLDTLALTVRHNLADPWKSRLAAQFDGITVEEYIQGQRAEWEAHAGSAAEIGMSQETEDAFRAAIRSAFSMEPRELSFFYFLYYCASAGSFASLVDVTGGQGAAEGTRFLHGTETLVEALRQEVGPSNVAAGVRVTSISDAGDSVTIRSGDGATWTAQYLIVATSPPASSPTRIDYSPALPAARSALCEAMAGRMGRSIKGFVRFKRPFWREQGRIGYLLSTAPYETDPVDWTLDNVWDPSNVNGSVQVSDNARSYLMTFIVGDAATFWTEAGKTKDDRARAVIAQLKRAYGFSDDLLYNDADPVSNYSEENWLTRIEAGTPAPVAGMPVGVLSKYGKALRDPVGRIHWAGSEAALEWCGYMDGAVESGFRAASEVLRRLL